MIICVLVYCYLNVTLSMIPGLVIAKKPKESPTKDFKARQALYMLVFLEFS